jgi:L-threonylcarbamoyladenylate synthase
MLILPDSAEAHRRAAQAIAEGGVIAFRTDTFYGLGADPFNREALRVLNSLKGREDGKPILVVISDESMVERFFASKSPYFDGLRGKYWPGALTLVGAARTDVPEELTAGTGTVGLRLPDDEEVRALVRACGGALTATSANLAGEAPARNAEGVARSFPGGLSLVVDGGETRADRPSTVLDVSGPAPRLIREGVVSRRELQRSFREIGLELE